MPGFIDVDLIGNQRGVDRMLDHIEAATSPVGLELFMQTTVEPWLRERAQQRFSNEGDDVVGKWEPLQPSTEMIRSQSGYGGDHPINVRTGDLEDYITQSPALIKTLPSGSALTYPGNKAGGELLAKVETAQGGKKYPFTVPRPVLGMNENDLLFVLTGLATHIQGF